MTMEGNMICSVRSGLNVSCAITGDETYLSTRIVWCSSIHTNCKQNIFLLHS